MTEPINEGETNGGDGMPTDGDREHLEARLAEVLAGNIPTESPEGIEIIAAATTGSDPLIRRAELDEVLELAVAFEYHAIESAATDEDVAYAGTIDTKGMLLKAIEQQDGDGGHGAQGSLGHDAPADLGGHGHLQMPGRRPSDRRAWVALAAAALLGALVLGWMKPWDRGQGAPNGGGRGPVLGGADGSRVALVQGDDGVERVVVVDLPTEFGDQRDQLTIQVQRRDPNGQWKTTYEGPLPSEGHALGAQHRGREAGTLRARAWIELDTGGLSPWSSGWVSLD